MKLSLLGSTGSIGVQALEVARHNNIKICALAAGNNSALMEMQAREFMPEIVTMSSDEAAADLKIRLADTSIKVLGGQDSVCEAAACADAGMVLNAIVGMQGLLPTMTALQEGKKLALANKESLVVGGKLVMEAAEKSGNKILPVDSEHSAIFQCLQGVKRQEVKKIILTASGGPFFGMNRKELEKITPPQALRHPNWSMGAKITIDSATLMNKGLEFIEAAWLFDMAPERIQILIHRESVIHSMVVLCDNAIIAQLGTPDMRLPIQYALTWPERCPSPADEPDFAAIAKFSFYNPDETSFGAISVCRNAFAIGGTAPAIVNGANEQAVEFFLKDRIPFLSITEIVAETLSKIKATPIDTIDDIMEADRKARAYVLATVHKYER